VPYFDRILDLTNIQAGKPKLNGFDFEISAQTNVQFSFSTIYDFLDTVTTSINNLSTKATSRAQENIDTAEGLIAQTSEEINYVEYPQAKQRLENALTNLTNQASSDNTTLQKIKTISTTINTPSDIQPNQQDITKIHQQITDLIDEEQNKLLAINLSESELESSYEDFLAMLNTRESNAPESKEITNEATTNLAFNFNLFTVSPETEKLITTAENPYKILLENKAPIINAFLEEINGSTPTQLNMTSEEYQINKSNLTNLKQQIAGFYQRLQPAQQTTLITKAEGITTNRQLTAGPTTASTANNQSSQIDPSAYINGIFSPTKDGKSLTKVVYSAENTKSIGNQYYLTDLNKDNTQDMILRDEHNVYIKYGKQNATFSRQAPKNTKFYTKKIDQLPNEETRLTFDKDTKLKIADTHEEVKNFAIRGQTFDSISFSRRPSRETNVDGYLIKLTDRIDYSPEKEDTNKNLIETYILVLPKGTEITGAQLAFPTPKLTRLITNEIQNRATPALKEATKNRLIGEIRYFDPNQTSINLIIENIERKRNYARIATLSETKGVLEINSPRSNQLVAGKQIIGDDQGPEGIASLYRSSTKETVSEGDTLDGFVGTHYNLIVNRTDNVLLTKMEIKAKGETLKTVELQAQSGTISINNLFFTGAQSQQYQFSATDHFGNTTTKDITLAIDLPDITITNIEKSTDTQAVITAELSQDIDEGNVTFQKNRNSYWTNLISKPNQTENYTLQPKQTEIQGNYYELNDKIALYSKADQIIAEIDPKTGEITIKDDRKNKVSLKVITSGNSLLIQVFTTAGELIFNITLPPQELVNVIAPKYTITSINDEYFGRYNKGKAIHRNGENILLVAPDGQIYTEKNLIGTYKYNPSNQTISYILKESALSENTIEIAIKVAPFDKEQ
jgi:hypothetical protein